MRDGLVKSLKNKKQEQRQNILAGSRGHRQQQGGKQKLYKRKCNNYHLSNFQKKLHCLTPSFRNIRRL